MKNLTAILFLITTLALQVIAHADVTIDLTQRQDVILEWDLPVLNTDDVQSDNSNITTAFLVVPVAIHKPMPPTNVRVR